MFCLKPPKDGSISYYNLNRGSVTDTEMDEMLGRRNPIEFQLRRGSELHQLWVATFGSNKKYKFKLNLVVHLSAFCLEDMAPVPACDCNHRYF